MIEDDPQDAELAKREIHRVDASCTFLRVDTREGMVAALRDFAPDVILTDHSLPTFAARDALAVAQQLAPETPVIVVTGRLGDEPAVQYLQAGAADYVVKDHLQRLGPAVLRALDLKRSRAAQTHAEQAVRASEARLGAIVRSALDAHITMDPLGNVTEWNPRAEAMFGWTAAEAAGRPLAEMIIPPALRQAHWRGLRHFAESGVGPILNRRLELTALRRDGGEFPVELSVTPIRIGNEWSFSAFLRDLTERKRAEDTLRRYAAQLEAANAELNAFAYSVSHDLRAPLRAIDGFSQALLEDYADRLDDAGKGHLARVRSASQRMATLIDDLLNLSRVTRSEMHIGPLDLSALASGIAEGLKKRDPARHVEFAIAPGLHAQADPGLIRVVLQNLLENAWKFTGKCSAARIELGSVPHDGRSAYFVRDNGAGFDMTYVGKLFGAFQRLHGAQEFDGTGIGLATVQRIIHRHGGRVWAEGAVGQGATFYFTL